jgi:hypothetical protein
MGPRSNRTGVSRPVARQAPPPPPSIPASTMPRPGAAPPPGNAAHHSAPHAPHGAPMHSAAPPPAMAPMGAQAPAMGGGGGLMGGLMGTVVQGMAFGTGSAVANRAVDAVMGPRQVEHVHTNTPAAAGTHTLSANLHKKFRLWEAAHANNGGDSQRYLLPLQGCLLHGLMLTFLSCTILCICVPWSTRDCVVPRFQKKWNVPPAQFASI